MATVIRAEISRNSKYWIDKHRHYELKHFCLQYPIWKKTYETLSKSSPMSISKIKDVSVMSGTSNPTEKRAVNKIYYLERIRMIEDTAKKADPALHSYILKAVTEELSFTYLKTKMNIPCGKDMYYDRYRRFFWLLNEARG